MRLTHALSPALTRALPLMAAVALAACGSDTDEELADEALTMDEVLSENVDNIALPMPGEYSTDVELISFEVPGASSVDMDALRAAFAEGAAEQPSFCVTEAMDREAWISAMTDNSCTISRLNADGTDISMAMSCLAENGPQGEITLTGTQGETSSTLEMETVQPIPGHGEANIVLRVTTERTGDCS
ncbi:DUF3617 domain-containing protein [Aurantiacibacter gilvus]|uniref:DUF3617 family protein n=1 Tax=Aurantiacibacter gilvus TaxID=3139141 RepID=A0ABU9IEP3_9SPHN